MDNLWISLLLRSRGDVWLMKRGRFDGTGEGPPNRPEITVEIQAPTHTPGEAGLDWVLDAFDVYEGRYRRDAVDAAVFHREAITPRLIAVLDRVLIDPETYLEGDHYAHVYAVMLLGYFRERSAHEKIVAVCGLPGHLPERLFGDAVTEDLPAILYETSGGSLDLVRQLAAREDADPYYRLAALSAMVYAALDGLADRREVLRFIASMIEPPAPSDTDFCSLAAIRALHLYPAEVMVTIERAFADGRIAPFVVSPEDFRDALADGEAATLARSRRRMAQCMPGDIHARMSWWAAFGDDQAAPVRPADPSGRPGNSAAEKKRKRQQQRASRRRNRRR